MKKIYSKIITIVICAFILIFSLSLIFIPKKEFSENENRYLESFPKFTFKSLMSGDFIESFEDYITDHFPFRDTFISIKTFIEKALGKSDINNVYLAKDDYLIQAYKKPVNNDKIIKVLKKFQEELNYVNMNLMLVPTSVTINKDLLPNNALNYSELDTIDYIYSNIDFDKIELYETFIEHKNDYQLYYRLDHHWTTYAAYYAYVEYAKHNNIDYYSLNSFDIKEVTKDFNGTLYSKTNDYTRKSDSIHIFDLKNSDYTVYYSDIAKTTNTLYEMSYLDKKDKYAMFLNNNHALIEITNNNLSNSKELVVIKDSYANSLIPFLINHYEKIYVIDPRYYKKSISEFIKSNSNIKDLLFVYNVNGLDDDLGIRSVR